MTLKFYQVKLKQQSQHKTKAMIICFPNNPTGTMLNRTELEALAEIAKKYDLL